MQDISLKVIYINLLNHVVTGVALFIDVNWISIAAVNCTGVNTTSLQNRNEIVMPDLPMGAEEPQEYLAVVNFNCTIPGTGMVGARSQQCVFDPISNMYSLVGDSLECRSKKFKL